MAQLDEPMQRLAVRQEIIDEQHVVVGVQIFLGHDDGKLLALGERVHRGGVLVAVEVDGLGLLGEHHRNIAEVACGATGDANARRLDGQDLGDGLAGEMPGPLLPHMVEQTHVALMVQERVHLEHVAGLDRSITPNVLFQLLHKSPLPVPSMNRTEGQHTPCR